MKEKPPDNGAEYFNSPIGKEREILDCRIKKKLESVRIMSLFLRVRGHFPIR